MNDRDTFEKWYGENCDYAGALKMFERSGEGYKFMQTQIAWSHWKDCRAIILSAAKQGITIDGREWQLVPVEPTEEMRDALHGALTGEDEGCLPSSAKYYGDAISAMLTAAKEQAKE